MRMRTLLLISVAVLALNGVYFVYFRYLDGPPDEPAGYGDTLARFSAASHAGEEVDWKRHWALLIYISESDDEALRNARYADAMADRFADMGLKVVGFVKGDLDRTRKIAGDNHLSYPVVSDGGLAWERRLTMEGQGYGVFLIDPMGTVRFSANRLEPHDLRQLVEVNLVGGVSPAEPASRLAVGGRFPTSQVLNLNQRNRLSLDELTEDVLVYFSGSCTSCTLENHMLRYADSEPKLEVSGRLPALVFSSKFVPGEIERIAQDLEIQAPLYLAVGTIEGVEDGYFLENLFEDDVVVFEQRERRVVSIRSLDDFIPQSQQPASD